MKRLAIILTLFLLTLPAQTLAGNFQQQDTPASECAGLARACTGAVRELVAARNLIKGYEVQIAASDSRLDLAQQEIESLKQLGKLEAERAGKLEAVIAAEREMKAKLLDIKAEQEKRIATLEKKLARSRKLNLIALTAAGVAVLIGVAK